MKTRSQHCDDDELRFLLESDDETGEFQSPAAIHVESCSSCQDRLTRIIGSGEKWQELRDMLQPVDGDDGSSGEIRRHRSGISTVRAALDETSVRELLAAPSHPEMLGRLGRYEIERVIGAGGMGIVLKGFDSELNRPVAVKLLAPHLARNGVARKRFAREARAAAAVVHEHVVGIYNVESDGETPFLVMQLVAGESLQARVERQGALEPREILRIGMQCAAGLAAAHAQGVVHRDVKPANILLESGVDRAYLTDFGLARVGDDGGLTRTGAVAGTPHYMSPEQADGQPVDQRSDLFSLGSVLYFMATGHPPFRAERPLGVLKRICHDQHRPAWEISPDVTDALSDIIDGLLQKSPNRRIASAAAAEELLAGALAELQQGRKRRGWLRRMARTKRIVVGAAASAVAVVAALAAFVFVDWNAGAPPKASATAQTAPATNSRSSDQSGSAFFEASLESLEWNRQVAEIESEISNVEAQPYLEDLLEE